MDCLPHLAPTRHNRPRTRHARLVAIHTLRRFLEDRVPALLEQSRRLLAIPAKRTDPRVISDWSRAAMHAVLHAPHRPHRDGIRDRAMLHRCCSAGRRVSAWLGLPLQALECPPSPPVRRHGQGRRARLFPLWKHTAADLRAWLAVRGPPQGSALFVNAREPPMTRAGFESVLRTHVTVAAAQCPSLTTRRGSPHVRRHTAALVVLHATGDIRNVSLGLGHTAIQTTEAYRCADPTEKLDALHAVVPPTLQRGQFRAPDQLIASLHRTSICQVCGADGRVSCGSFLDHSA